MDSMSSFALGIMEHKYSFTPERDGVARVETWPEISYRVPDNVLRVLPGITEADVQAVARLIRERKFLPGGRYLYASGRPFHQVQNCLLNRAEDSREGWSDSMHKACMGLMTGAGLGVWYGDVRPEGSIIKGTGGFATGPCSLMQMHNEAGRHIMQGGSRRSALWAGLPWSHPDIFKFIALKDWSPEVRAMKAKDFNFPATLDMTNISVGLDDEFFAAYYDPTHAKHTLAHGVYWEVVKHMLKTGEPGFSVNLGENANEVLRNACTEVTSADDSDICNLGSINMARITSVGEFEEVMHYALLLLLAGTVYSRVPYQRVADIREKNRRLGLGLMGLHEFLLLRGKSYGPDAELQKYLELYATSTDVAGRMADKYSLSRPIKTRAIAPTGTIGILAETTTGMEPIFCAAYKRRYLKGKTWNYEYVLDPTAKRLVEVTGIDPDKLEDAYTLANDVPRRLQFQSWLQKYVDHSISSTINLPEWGSEFNNESTVQKFGNDLLRELPNLRGVTVYPDGARGGQPLNPVRYKTAMKHVGQIFVEAADICDITKGGTCGS